MTTHIAPHNEDPIAARSGWALAMLMVVYILNFVDRQIIGILAVPIKADLGLTDTQLGLLGGFAFALFYTFLAIPIAILADEITTRPSTFAGGLSFGADLLFASGLVFDERLQGEVCNNPMFADLASAHLHCI